MNLCIDQGNTRTKTGIFDRDELVDFRVFDDFGPIQVAELASRFPLMGCILSSVVAENKPLIDDLEVRFHNFIVLSHTTPVPLVNAYKTPETLGKDRLAAVAGACFLKPGCNLLVVDAGTAITYDFVDSDCVYHGGNIAPGLELRLRSLHEFTSKLPRVEAQTDCPELGYDTSTAILSGALNGIVHEIDGYFDRLKIKYPELFVFLTGGSAFYFAEKLKNPIFVEPNLVLIGLNRILQYNVQK